MYRVKEDGLQTGRHEACKGSDSALAGIFACGWVSLFVLAAGLYTACLTIEPPVLGLGHLLFFCAERRGPQFGAS